MCLTFCLLTLLAKVMAICGERMNLPLFKDDNQTLQLLQTRWAAILNPVIATPLINGVVILNQPLLAGPNTFPHLLSRQMQGWIITDQNAAVTIYRSKPLNSVNLTLTASAPVQISLWVF